MKCVTLYEKETGRLFSEQVYKADKWYMRLKGLMGKRRLPNDYCLWIQPCNQVHMMHMHFSIDVIYLDENNRVIDIDKGLKPWTFGKKRPAATSVIECATGCSSSLVIGSILKEESL